MKNNRQVILRWCEIIGMIILYGVLDTSGSFKYLMVFAISMFILGKHFKECTDIWNEIYLFVPGIICCGLGTALALLNGEVTSWTIKTLLFWSLPPLFAFAMKIIYIDDLSHMMEIQFYGCAGAYLITKGYYLYHVGQFESPFAFSFGLFAIYFAYRKKWLFSAISIFIMYLANKKIALLALVCCFVLMLLIKIFKYSKKCIVGLGLLSFSAYIFYVYSILSGFFQEFCIKYGIDTSYRALVYEKIVANIPSNYYLGKGLGATNAMLKLVLEPGLYQWFENPHNDFLKLFVDLGTVGFIAFLSSYFFVFYIAWKKGIKKKGFSQLFVIITFFMLLMLTDNVSIYIIFLVPMHSICLTLVNEKGKTDENHAK